jgi:hypothetical protein
LVRFDGKEAIEGSAELVGDVVAASCFFERMAIDVERSRVVSARAGERLERNRSPGGSKCEVPALSRKFSR